MFQQEFGPVLALPVKANISFIRPEIDENGHIDWGAFGTIDFDRYSGGFNKILYKADKINEQFKDLKIMLGIISDRIKTKAKYMVLKYYERGIIELNHIVNTDMQALARKYIQAKKLLQEIKHLRQASGRYRLRKAALL